MVDGAPVDLSKTMAYKGMMYSDVPNLASAFGYTNASWTLKCDLTAEYVCRLLKHMDQHGYAQCTPRVNDPELTEEPVLDFTSGYVLRALHTLPRQGSKTPWRLHQNYVKDLSMLRFGRVDDGTMEFKAAPESAPPMRGRPSMAERMRLEGGTAVILSDSWVLFVTILTEIRRSTKQHEPARKEC